MILDSFGLERFTPDENFSRLRPYFQDIKGEIQKNFTIVTVAGTNGKGEVSFQLTELFRQANYQVFTWMSPHIVNVTERFRLNGEEISEVKLNQLLENIAKAKLSFYEALFVAFIHWVYEFKNAGEKAVIIFEVGIGGRLDAVNFFDADGAVLTSIGRDHQEVLGSRLEQILKEKLGVTRQGKLLVSNLTSNYLRSLTHEWCDSLGVRWIDVGCTPMMNFSQQNAILATTFFEALTGLKAKKLSSSFHGRNEFKTWNGLTLNFFGSHNIDGMRMLFHRFRLEKKRWPKILAAFSAREEKEIKAMVQLLQSMLESEGTLFLSAFPHPRAWNPNQLRELEQNANRVQFLSGPEEFFDKNPKGEVLVTGSYFFVGHVQKLLQRDSGGQCR